MYPARVTTTEQIGTNPTEMVFEDFSIVSENQMPKLAKTSSEFSMSPASQMSFAISACAFAAAGIGLVVNHWLTGWMAVGGMSGVGLFYLAVGILNLRSRNAFDDDESMASVSQRTARSDNLYAEAVARPRIDIASKPPSSSPFHVNHDN